MCNFVVPFSASPNTMAVFLVLGTNVKCVRFFRRLLEAMTAPTYQSLTHCVWLFPKSTAR